MSTKPKKKTVKSKKVKKAPLKLSYTDEEKIELKKKYEDILFHLSNFLSEHSVYEAVPENVKILVFSSELSFYEMIKVFIFEDIYCSLIYNPEMNNYLGLLTTRDLMLLYKYIIINFPNEPINNFELYLKTIFSDDSKKNNNDIKTSEEKDNIINNMNIFTYLKNINYVDYLLYVKNKELQNINIFSVSLDDNLYETLKKINIKNIHRLLVEDDNKNEFLEKQKLIGEEKEPEIKIKRKDEYNNKKVMSNAEKTTTANDSDEDYKNNNKLDMKKILETNKENIIIEKSEHTLSEIDKNISKDIFKDKSIEIKEKNEEKIIQKKDDEIIENLNINEIESKKEAEKPKKKKIIKKKKILKKDSQNLNVGSATQVTTTPQTPREESSKSIKTEPNTEIKKEVGEKKVIKKIIKKKVTKKKNDLKLELPGEIMDKKEEKAHHKMNTNITEINTNKDTFNIGDDKRVITEENENKGFNKTEVKKKVIKKVKKKIIKKKSQRTDVEKTEEKKEIKENNDKKENKEKEIIQENKEITQENKEIIQDNNNNENNNKDKIETEIKKQLFINNDNEDIQQNEKKETNDEEKIKNIEKIEEEKIIEENKNIIINTQKQEKQDSLKSLKNIRFGDKMKNYIGIVTNETIFEYLVFNYYSSDMKEFDLSLNELLILENISFIEKLTTWKNASEKVYNTFNTYLEENYDIIPIFSKNEIEGFIYPKDFLFYIYNCESDQNLTNGEFLQKLYKDIDEEKPYGKNRVEYLELNDNNKSLYVKELIEGLNCSIEKKIVISDTQDKNNLYLISLKSIFKAIVKFNLNK